MKGDESFPFLFYLGGYKFGAGSVAIASPLHITELAFVEPVQEIPSFEITTEFVDVPTLRPAANHCVPLYAIDLPK